MISARRLILAFFSPSFLEGLVEEYSLIHIIKAAEAQSIIRSQEAADVHHRSKNRSLMPPNAQEIHGNALDLPVPDNSFDVGVINMLLQDLTGEDVAAIIHDMSLSLRKAQGSSRGTRRLS